MATKKQNKYTVEWTGKPPRMWMGQWHIKKNGQSIDQFLPTDKRCVPAFTYGEYPVWEQMPFVPVQQFVTDGYRMPEWIQENMYWLQLMCDEDIDYQSIYLAFHEFDFRTTSMM